MGLYTDNFFVLGTVFDVYMGGEVGFIVRKGSVEEDYP